MGMQIYKRHLQGARVNGAIIRKQCHLTYTYVHILINK